MKCYVCQRECTEQDSSSIVPRDSEDGTSRIICCDCSDEDGPPDLHAKGTKFDDFESARLFAEFLTHMTHCNEAHVLARNEGDAQWFDLGDDSDPDVDGWDEYCVAVIDPGSGDNIVYKQ